MTDRKLPDYLLERLALGELPKKAAREAQEQLAKEPGGAERLKALRESNQALLARHPPEVVAKEIARRSRSVTVSLPQRVAWLVAPAAAIVALILAVVLRPEQTLIKGDAALLVYRVRDGQAELLKNGALVQPGNTLQLAYTRARKAYGVILSIDGAGKLTLHLPEREGEPARLVREKRTQLPHAYELDTAPGFERFFLVSSETRFPTSQVMEAARALVARGDLSRTESLALPRGLEQTSFLVLKAGR